MRQRVLLFFPHNPWPPQTGAHRRCLEMLAGLKEIGCQTVFLSSTVTSETKWDRQSIEGLKDNFVWEVFIYEGNPWDYRFINYLKKFYNFIKITPPLNSLIYTPVGMRNWFKKISHKILPDIIMMNFAYWDRLINHRRLKSKLRIIDTYDLVSLNRQMWRLLGRFFPLPPIKAKDVSDEALEEDFFNGLNLIPDPKEFLIYDRYDYTIAISEKEKDIIKKNTHNTKVLFIPMTYQPYYIQNDYSGPALFPTGPNPFNIQGYFYFVKKVLPKVCKQASSFSLQVTGTCCEYVSEEEGIILRGFVPDIKTVYESTRFVVVPLLGGTGQQIKITEAMAYGIPVIALRSVAEDSPLRHKINGLIANNAEEFADYTIQLWNDQKLCRKLGEAARETISSEFSRSRLVKELSLIIR